MAFHVIRTVGPSVELPAANRVDGDDRHVDGADDRHHDRELDEERLLVPNLDGGEDRHADGEDDHHAGAADDHWEGAGDDRHHDAQVSYQHGAWS